MPQSKRLYLSTFAIYSMAGALGCPTKDDAANFEIHVGADTVNSIQAPNHSSFDVSVTIINRGPGPLVVSGCSPTAERQINGAWEVALSPNCILMGHTELAAGDSAVLHVEETDDRPHATPIAETGLFPGTYRLVFGLSVPSRSSPYPGPSKYITGYSPVFVVK